VRQFAYFKQIAFAWFCHKVRDILNFSSANFSLDLIGKFFYPSLMDAQSAVDLCRDAIWMALMVASPILIAGVIIGLIIGLLQALTQIQEQTIAIVLKIIVMILVVAYTMPWMSEIMIEHGTNVFRTIPGIIPANEQWNHAF
jgi:flagellar biosynthetic protein FliQ